ncbi:MAG: hypothetical protein ABI679_09490 [Gemmatimonadota bacterium]
MTAASQPERSTLLDPFVIVGLAGILFFVVGLTEVIGELYPWALGAPEWEFGTYSSMMDKLPLLTMGLGFITVFAIARSQRVLAKVVGTLFILFALFIFAGAFLYATNVPQALRVNPRSPTQTGIKKAISKSAIQTTVYPIAFLWAGFFALRHSAKSRRQVG